MSANPYAPPRAAVSDVASSTPMQAPARKPVAVWLTQAVELLLGALPCSQIVQAFRDAGRDDTALTVAKLVFHSVVLGAVLAGVLGAQRRHGVGRWAGVALLGFAAVLVAYAGVGRFTENARRGDPFACGVDSVFCIALLAACAFWIHRGAFSARARAWYGSHA